MLYMYKYYIMFSDSNKKEFTGFNGLQVLIFSDGIDSEILYLYADQKKNPKGKRERGPNSTVYSVTLLYM